MNVKLWPTLRGILRGFLQSPPPPHVRDAIRAANSPRQGPQPLHVQIACAFALGLYQHLGPSALAEIDQLNRQRHGPACASHDYLDANECMNDAFRSVFDRNVNLQDPEDTRLWQQAWTFAKQTGFLNIVLARKDRD